MRSDCYCPAPVIDASLGERQAFGRPQVWRAALRLLLAELPNTVAGLRSAFVRRHLGDLAGIAHRLHGASCFCGTPILKESAAYLESACKKGDWRIIEEGFDRLMQSIDQLLSLASAKSGILD